jgi:hypothetical protein
MKTPNTRTCPRRRSAPKSQCPAGRDTSPCRRCGTVVRFTGADRTTARGRNPGVTGCTTFHALCSCRWEDSGGPLRHRLSRSRGAHPLSGLAASPSSAGAALIVLPAVTVAGLALFSAAPRLPAFCRNSRPRSRPRAADRRGTSRGKCPRSVRGRCSGPRIPSHLAARKVEAGGIEPGQAATPRRRRR